MGISENRSEAACGLALLLDSSFAMNSISNVLTTVVHSVMIYRRERVSSDDDDEAVISTDRHIVNAQEKLRHRVEE